jgi:hypothetical protein
MSIHGRQDDNFPRFVIFPVQDAKFTEIENELFFCHTFCLEDLSRMTKDE